MLRRLFKKETVEDIIHNYANENKEFVDKISWIMNNQFFINALLNQAFKEEVNSLDKLRSSIPKLEHAVDTFIYLIKNSDQIKSVVYDKQAVVEYSRKFLSEFKDAYRGALSEEVEEFSGLYKKLSAEEKKEQDISELIYLSKKITLMLNSSLSDHLSSDVKSCFGNDSLCSIVNDFSNYEESKSRVGTAVELVKNNFYKVLVLYFNHDRDNVDSFDALLSSLYKKLNNLKTSSKRLLDKKLFERVERIYNEIQLIKEDSSFRSKLLSLNDNLTELIDEVKKEDDELSYFKASYDNKSEGVKKVQSIIRLLKERELLSNQLRSYHLTNVPIVKKYFSELEQNIDKLSSNLINKGNKLLEDLININFNKTYNLKRDLEALNNLEIFYLSLNSVVNNYVKILNSKNNGSSYADQILVHYNKKMNLIHDIKTELDEVSEHDKYLSSAIDVFKNKFPFLEGRNEFKKYLLDASLFLSKEKTLRRRFSEYLNGKINFAIGIISEYKGLAEKRLSNYNKSKINCVGKEKDKNISLTSDIVFDNGASVNKILMSIHNILSSSDSSDIEENINLARDFYGRLNTSSVNDSDKRWFNSFLRRLSKKFMSYDEEFNDLLLV